MELFDLYRTKLAYFAEIVSSQIDQHIVFGQFLFRRQAVVLQALCLPLRFCLSVLSLQAGKCAAHHFSSFTRVSGDAPATSTSVPGKIKHIW